MTGMRRILFILLIGFSFSACNANLNPESRPESAQAITPDFVALDGACFEMGETRIYPEEGPLSEVCVAPFEIARYELTHGEFARFVEATGYVTRAERGWRADEPDGPGVDLPPGSAQFTPPTNPAEAMNWWRYEEGVSWRTPNGVDGAEPDPNAPVVHLTRADAQAYADWAGARLPSEAEWEYAARGGLDGALYTWDEAEQIALSDRANTWEGLFPVVNTADDGYAGLAPVGSYPPNGFGLHDMAGNVWEWTASPYTPRHDHVVGPNGLDPNQPGIAVGTIRGGSYLCARSYCYRFRPAARQAQDLAFGTSHIGVRLARDVTSNVQALEQDA